MAEVTGIASYSTEKARKQWQKYTLRKYSIQKCLLAL